jgi:hypothetical protein
VDAVALEALVKEVKTQWQGLWHERIDDKVRAEGIANKDYSMLFVDKGTVVFATRDFRLPNLKEILQQHSLSDVDRMIQPSPMVGGWGKFVRTKITNGSAPRISRAALYQPMKKACQQLKKGGRGWLHK